MPSTINLAIPRDAAERVRQQEAARSCECPRCGRHHHRLAASPPEAVASQAMKAVEALRTPDASLRAVPNTIRQGLADVIEAQKRKMDRYGVVLMMIREGVADPADFARAVLAQGDTESPLTGPEQENR